MVKNDGVYYHKLNLVCYCNKINDVLTILRPFMMFVVITLIIPIMKCMYQVIILFTLVKKRHKT